MKTLVGFVALGASVVLLAQACGSSDGKKKAPVRYTSGGEGGQGDGGSAGTKNSGASSSIGASSGEGGGEPGMTGGNGGTPNMTGDAGEANTSGGSGGSQSGDNCPPGFGDCDDDPSECEQPLNLVTSCGACGVTCKSTNAAVVCDPLELECKITDCSAGYGSCDNNENNGCETLLTSNASHCGGCGRDCAALGSTCAVDRCDKIPLQTGIVLGPRSWAFGPSGAFFAGFYNYVLQRLPLDGAQAVTVWAASMQTAGTESLLATASEVFWAQRGNGAFKSGVLKKAVTAAAAANPVLVFTPEYQPTYLRIQGNAYYWMSGDYQSGDPGGYVYTRSVSETDVDEPGTRIVTVDQGTHGAVLDFMTTSNALYWVTLSATNGAANELRTAPLAGGVPVAVPPVTGAGTVTAVTSGYGVPVLLAIGDTVYFNRNVDTDPKNGIYSFKTGDAKPTLIVPVEDVNTMVADDEYVYYASQNVTGIFKAPLSGGAGVQISDGYWTRIVGQSGKFVYAYGYGVNNMYKIIK